MVVVTQLVTHSLTHSCLLRRWDAFANDAYLRLFNVGIDPILNPSPNPTLTLTRTQTPHPNPNPTPEPEPEP